MTLYQHFGNEGAYTEVGINLEDPACVQECPAAVFADLNAESGGDKTSVQGRVRMPEEVPEGIHIDGLTLDKVVLLLEGYYKHPRMPYPSNWKSMTREERSSWHHAFINSDDWA